MERVQRQQGATNRSTKGGTAGGVVGDGDADGRGGFRGEGSGMVARADRAGSMTLITIELVVLVVYVDFKK